MSEDIEDLVLIRHFREAILRELEIPCFEYAENLVHEPLIITKEYSNIWVPISYAIAKGLLGQ